MVKNGRKFEGIEEPTLGEVLAVMNERMDGIGAVLIVMNERMDGVDARLVDLQRGQTKFAAQVADIQDDLTSALSASDNDGSAILNHEHRISHLERLGGIKSVPATHLLGLD